MADEEKKTGTPETEDVPKRETEEESNAAKRLRALGGEAEDPIHDAEEARGGFFANFWYHHKWKLIIGAAFAFILITGISQYAARSNPDATMLYAGTRYITATQNDALCDIFERMTGDRNGDGKAYVLLNDVVFYTERQLENYAEWCRENNLDMTIDRMANKQATDRYVQQVWAEPLLCIFESDQYGEVARSGGFMRLDEVFADDPGTLARLKETAVDDYGVRFADTPFCQFYEAARIFPEDAVIAVRTLPTMSALTGKKKAKEAQEANLALFRAVLSFEFPEGWEPEAPEGGEG